MIQYTTRYKTLFKLGKVNITNNISYEAINRVMKVMKEVGTPGLQNYFCVVFYSVKHA